MASSSKFPFEVTDFSGGITDNVYSGDQTTAYEMDNFFIQQDKKIFTRPGSELDDATNSPIPAGNQRIGLLWNYAKYDKLFIQSGQRFYYRPTTTGAWNTLTGPSGNQVLSAGDTTSHVSASEWNKQIMVVSDAWAHPMKIFKDGGGTYQVRNIGLPALASAPTVTVGTAALNNYVYAFVLTYTYTVFTKTFEEIGPTLWVTVTASSDPGTHANTISAIPVLSNSTTDNYDTSNIKVEIYRTINNGTNFYKVGSVTNGTTTFTDNVSDASLQNNAGLYINDGTLDYYPAPKAKFIHIVGNTGFYAYTNDSSGEHPYRVHQSIIGNPGFVPQDTWEEVEDEAAGIGSVKGLPILFCKKLIFRLDGTYDNYGRGGINPVEIHHTAGCISHASIVEAENYVFWAGNDGFYASDGYMVTKISDHLNSRYSTITSAMASDTMRIVGKFDELNRRVYWTVKQDSGSADNDSIFALDLRWGISPQSRFTTASGTSFKPTALEIFNDYLYRGDNNGFVFRHDPTLTTDPKVDTSKAAANWYEEAIIWNYVSNHFNINGSFYRKIVTRILLQAANYGNTTIQVVATNDQGKKVRDLKIIRWRRNLTWGDDAIIWGNSDCVWNAEGLIEEWRRMPAGGLRLSYIQIQITNGKGVVTNSSVEGTATLTNSTKQVYLAAQWPAEVVDYAIAFSYNNYLTTYTVSAVSSDLKTITVLDPQSTLPPDGTYSWELTGYTKGEVLYLLGYNLHWDNVDQNQLTYASGDDGTL